MLLGHAVMQWGVDVRSVIGIGMTKRRRIALAAALVIAVVFGLGLAIRAKALEGRMLRADPEAAAGDSTLMAFAAPRGKRVYQAHCAACHGARGQGDTARAVANLTDDDWLYGDGLVSDIEQVVEYGIRAHAPRTWNLAEMPAYATPVPTRTEKIPPLSPGDIRDVTELLMLIARRPADQTAAARGSAIFQNRGGCFDCHGNDARGDSAIGAPNLTDQIWLDGDGSREAITRSIAHGLHGTCPAWYARLRPAAIREVALYVYSLSHPRKAPVRSAQP
jgi:cytochrome c oxidase cbb3-type subunit 3